MKKPNPTRSAIALKVQDGMSLESLFRCLNHGLSAITAHLKMNGIERSCSDNISVEVVDGGIRLYTKRYRDEDGTMYVASYPSSVERFTDDAKLITEEDDE